MSRNRILCYDPSVQRLSALCNSDDIHSTYASGNLAALNCTINVAFQGSTRHLKSLIYATPSQSTSTGISKSLRERKVWRLRVYRAMLFPIWRKRQLNMLFREVAALSETTTWWQQYHYGSCGTILGFSVICHYMAVLSRRCASYYLKKWTASLAAAGDNLLRAAGRLRCIPNAVSEDNVSNYNTVVKLYKNHYGY